ncbi:hypothetical protein LZ554_000486 [Drepanopeziza brunnea f. sp. 'monogermtubi']|nr:hypothetical protein LZ554_000486 [Drepanopeziza brunnea f. sp. 'monogermtubi']
MSRLSHVKEEKIRRALREVSESANTYVQYWWEDFRRTPRASRRRGCLADQLFRSADPDLRSCRNAWLLHEWIFAIACLLLDGHEEGTFNAEDVVRQVYRNRETVTFNHWRWVNDEWLNGRRRKLKHPVVSGGGVL